ncbi:hypothetical protein E3P96_01968 [Wallemia ichthyophaga]|nr:hypothetical protein E3P96_01968 [Wallemia ichthyophaga]
MSTQLPFIPNTEPERCILDSYKAACAVELNKSLDLPLEKAYEGVHVGSKNGDFHIALPRFRLPGDVKEHAQKVHDNFKPNEYIEKCTVKQGFVTFQATTQNFIRNVLDQIHYMSNKSPSGKPEYGTSTISGQGKHVIIEFSSPNIAKPFHAGHLRSTIIGAFLANLYEACGWKVTRMNYLGDWGKQFGLLGVGFERYGSQEKLKVDPIGHLFEVYVRVNNEAKEEDEKLGKKSQDIEEGGDEQDSAPIEAGNTINDQARRFFKRMEDGEEGPLSLWKQFRDLSIEKYKDTYARLNIHFDVYSGESQISQENQNKAIDVLHEKGLIKQSGQSQIIDLEEYKLGKAVVKKMDGTTLYLTRDFAAAAERHENYHFDKMIYVIASQQDLHTAQLFKAMDLIGYDWAKNLLHINFGMVMGMSTRKGTAVFLDQILNEAKSVMLDVMKKDSMNKYDQLENPEWTADTLGLSAVKIQDMAGRRIMNYKFAWDRMTSFEGDTGPYLQYAHVRMSSIQRKVADETVLPEDPTKDVDTKLLTEPKARELVYLLSQYPDVVKNALKTHEPNNIVSYAFQLTHVVSSLLEMLKVKGQEKKLAEARLYLFMSARDVLGSAMRLLTLTPLEKIDRKRTNSGSSDQKPVKPVGSTSSTLYNNQPEGLKSYHPSLVPPTAEEAARLAHQTPPHTSPTTVADAEGLYTYSTSFRKASLEANARKPSLPHLKPSELPSPFDSAAAEKKEDDDRRKAMTHSLESDPAHTSTPSAQYAKLSVDQTIARLNTNPKDGLSSADVKELRPRYGFNEFSVEAGDSLFKKFFEQIYESPLILLLLGSAVVSALVGNVDDSISISLAVIIVLTVQFVQETRSEKSLQALNKLVPHYCHLVRGGQNSSPLANDLIPGDVVTFSTGDRIPADVRIIEAVDLEIDESNLTGETKPTKKTTEQSDLLKVGVSDRKCIAHMGTLVRSGHGRGLVVGTGSETEFGVVFTMMQDVEERRTPLQYSMDELAKQLSIISFAVIGVIFLIGIIQSRSWLEMFTIGVSLAVAAIPEGLPVVTTVTLALGVLRMSKRKAIVKKLPSVESLGSVSVICSDKTGTLTKNIMTVTKAFTVPDGPISIDGKLDKISPALERTLLIGNICNNARKDEHGKNVGQPTDVALVDVIEGQGTNDKRTSFVRRHEQAFSSESKVQLVTGTLASDAEGKPQECNYLKGALERVLERCDSYLTASGHHTVRLDDSTRQLILSRGNECGDKGLRNIGMAYRISSNISDFTSGFIFTGFQGMKDPPRPGVAASIASLQRAGVHVVMITGDAERTALAIARELGLCVRPASPSTNSRRDTSECLTGLELDNMSERELMERINSVSVFARTSPKHKMRIIGVLQKLEKVVAMTGDGVNDAPALKMADIGVSMGKGGTDVAKEAADCILVDDNFATLLPAVEEGKSIFYNIQNFLSFQLSTAVAALSLITISTALRMRNPLNAMQILFINVIMDGPPSQSLGVDPVNKTVMKRPPRPKNASVITNRLLTRVLFSASIIITGVLFIYAYEIGDGFSTRDQTMTFTAFVVLDLASALQNRGVTCGFGDNKMLLITVAVSFLAQMCFVYIPTLQAVFQTEALALRDMGVLSSLVLFSIGLHEIRRRWEREQERKDALFSFSNDDIQKMVTLKLGTRKSKLAMIQANIVKASLENRHPDIQVEIVGMSTAGDRDNTTSLYTLGGADKGLWTKELENALLDNSVDIIVHSLKDVQSQLPEGCILGAFPQREDPTDALVVKKGLPYQHLSDIPDGSVVGTSSIRRVAQLRRSFPRLTFKDVRGNLDTRIAKLDNPEGEYTAIILASAGLKRVSQEYTKRITSRLTSPTLLYAVGQGCLGLETRADDAGVANYVDSINCKETQVAVTVERALLRTLEGGCSAPVGVETSVSEKEGAYYVDFTANLTTLDGSTQIKQWESRTVRSLDDADKLGVDVAYLIKSNGGEPIMAAIHNSKTNQIIEKTNIVQN